MTDATFEVSFLDGTSVVVDDASAYQQEGSMTTFFRTDGDRQVFNSWAVRVASYRTESLTAIVRRDRRCEDARALLPA